MPDEIQNWVPQVSLLRPGSDLLHAALAPESAKTVPEIPCTPPDPIPARLRHAVSKTSCAGSGASHPRRNRQAAPCPPAHSCWRHPYTTTRPSHAEYRRSCESRSRTHPALTDSSASAPPSLHPPAAPAPPDRSRHPHSTSGFPPGTRRSPPSPDSFRALSQESTPSSADFHSTDAKPSPARVL